MKNHLGDDKPIKKQSITMTTIFGKAIEAVVAYIVLFFFKPVWNKLVEWWKGKDESNS